MENLSFYDVGGFRENMRRYKNGIDQLCDIQTMLKERIDIEANYSKSLQQYNDKWSEHVEKLPSSAIKSVWSGVLTESVELQKLHFNVKDRINDEIMKTIALYLKENHHPSPFRSSREMREIEDDFYKAQRLWRRQLERVEKAKKAFHNASKAERSAQLQLKNASGDSAVSTDLEGKYRERYQRCTEDVQKTDKAYRSALADLNLLKKGYVSHMDDVFESCQQKELKRLKFAFEMLSGLQKVVVDIPTATKLISVHRNLQSELAPDENRFNSDLKKWSETNGPDSKFTWPIYEPYTPSLHMIASKKGKNKDAEVVLMRKTVRSDDYERNNSMRSLQSANLKVQESVSHSPSINSEINVAIDNDTRPVNGAAASPDNASNEVVKPVSSAAGAVVGIVEVTNNASNSLSASGTHQNFVPSDSSTAKNLVPFKAKVLHDYDAQDDDELSLKKGEEMEVLSGPDHFNWSLGKNSCRSGLFPSSYVEKL